jgi:RimJ/RimL family protein N-acetyltransferase
MASDRGWVYKIVPDLEDIPEGSTLNPDEVSSGVGTIGIWTGEWKDQPATEMCWGVAPKFQGNKFASKAVKLILEKAVLSGRWGTIHVFTSTSNAASNALCTGSGFQLLGEESIDYDGRELHTYHYTYETMKP